ncbi:SLAM family member 5-like [Puntigrus tetrazona]|uniref:SLAM family member 5-like n=1 Tax=Puntigrus tetrazona TaxID=1606681 RepID=UPI001C89C3C8|nr:SLAM family member 5-like [Puntigrus tetrazona]
MFSLLLGVYEVRKMIHSASVFCLCLLLTTGAFGADTDAVKSVSVTEGDSVHLNTDVTEVQTDDQILWMFGSKETRIAEIHRQNVYTEDSTHIFGDRLQMDSQTGSLTIRNIRTTDSGLYKLQIISNRETLYKRFSVGVYAALSLPVISRDFSQHSQSERSSLSRCSLLCSVVNVGHVTLSWYKGNSLLSSISVSDLSISLSLPLEVEHQEKNTYSCVINNTIRNQTQHLDISQLCAELGERSRLNILIAVIALLLVLVVVSSLMYRHRKHKQSKKKLRFKRKRYFTPVQLFVHIRLRIRVSLKKNKLNIQLLPILRQKRPPC